MAFMRYVYIVLRSVVFVCALCASDGFCVLGGWRSLFFTKIPVCTPKRDNDFWGYFLETVTRVGLRSIFFPGKYSTCQHKYAIRTTRTRLRVSSLAHSLHVNPTVNLMFMCGWDKAAGKVE